MEGKVLQEKRKKKNIYTYPVYISCLQEITIWAVRNAGHVIIFEKEKENKYLSNVKDNVSHKNCIHGAIFMAVMLLLHSVLNWKKL